MKLYGQIGSIAVFMPALLPKREYPGYQAIGSIWNGNAFVPTQGRKCYPSKPLFVLGGVRRQTMTLIPYRNRGIGRPLACRLKRAQARSFRCAYGPSPPPPHLA